MDKITLRKALKQQRNSFSPQHVAESSKAVVEQLLKWQPYQRAHSIMAYLAFGKELSLDALLVQALAEGKRVCVPYIISATEMLAVEITSLEQLKLDRYGIRSVKEPLKEVSPKSLELILVPGVAFGKNGSRMGMGAGYYDRFLPKATNALTCGVAYTQLLQQELPIDQYDVPVNYIVHEKDIFQIG